MNASAAPVEPVVLIQAPFAVTSWPSLGLGLLKAALAREGVESSTLYLNGEFARLIGEAAYLPLSLGAPLNTDLLAEWVFSEALWGPDAARDQTYLEDVLQERLGAHRTAVSRKDIEEAWSHAQTARAQVEPFLEACLGQHDWERRRLVGFTSVFQQHLASLALAKRLKARFPHLLIVMGGANCEGEMGLATLRAFDFVDAACIGEGDLAFPRYVKAVLAGEPPPRGNVVAREHLQALPADALATPEPPVDMDALPHPDFDDYFEQCSDWPREEAAPLRIVFETSRGCWWGQKHHCTFCGLNGTAMAFRHKSAPRAIEEIRALLDRYGRHTQRFGAADNIIPYQYFSDFLPTLVDLKMDLALFYETKANLKKDQLVCYKQAGLAEIQPGIESLDTDVLRLMRKGVSGIQNIQLLKWCKELGVTPLWNYLYGFPRESAEAYPALATAMSALWHLDPPGGSGQLRFDRFSPYVSSPEAFGVSNLRPYPAYGFLYPGLDETLRRDLAYYFVGDYPEEPAIGGYLAQLRGAIQAWRDEAPGAMLAHVEEEASTVVLDSRAAQARAFHLGGLHHKVIAQSDAIVSVAQLDLEPGEEAELPRVLAELRRYGLIWVEGERLIRLSVPLFSDYQPAAPAMDKIRAILSQGDGTGTAIGALLVQRSRVTSLSTVKPREALHA